MDTLSPRHVKIITRRFMDDQPVSLETIGREEGITRERVRQIENALRSKLRALLEDIADDLGIDVDTAMVYVLPVVRKSGDHLKVKQPTNPAEASPSAVESGTLPCIPTRDDRPLTLVAQGC